ncbi:MAG: cellulase family glycosylhydrolase [Planctomycetes bacterium]|nr:cellulase family glycosylhydrolase [Planctomycetota bacterium]
MKLPPLTLAVLLLLSACAKQTPPPTSAAPATPQPDPTQTPAPVTVPTPDLATHIGVNLAGGEFGKMPGRFNYDYTYPKAEDFDYFHDKHLDLIRLPFKWERVQPKLMGPLDEAELKRLDAVVALARERGMHLLLDAHNYARYNGKVIGTPDVPNDAFADFWRKLADHYKSEPAVFGYSIMNEPHGTNGLWPAAAQAAVDAIRTVDMNHTIAVCGEGYAGAHWWPKVNPNLDIHDPADNFVYEAHQYFDKDNSGTYRGHYDDKSVSPDTGVQRLQPFIQWLDEHHARGFIGEFGVPDNDPRWLVVLDRFIAEMKAHNLGGTYWAAGPWFGSYPVSVQPRDGKDRPQMQVLDWYAGDRQRPADVAIDVSHLPPAPTPGAYLFSDHPESYHYNNPESKYKSAPVDDATLGYPVRQITYEHKGNPAYIGIGLYFGSLNVKDFAAFALHAKADHPVKLTVKIYTTDKSKYEGTIEVAADWQTHFLAFDDLRKAGAKFDPAKPIEKIELQPANNPAANTLYLASLKPVQR